MLWSTSPPMNLSTNIQAFVKVTISKYDLTREHDHRTGEMADVKRWKWTTCIVDLKSISKLSTGRFDGISESRHLEMTDLITSTPTQCSLVTSPSTQETR